MKMLEKTSTRPDKRFKTNPPADFLAALSVRIADELRTVSHPDKDHLIPETVVLTMRLNELKNRIRSGCGDGYSNRNEYEEYLRGTGALYRLLGSMGITPTRSDTGIFAVDLCAAARKWIEECMADADIESFYPC
jgi:hypothetical protein